jgi:hypothetical protein
MATWADFDFCLSELLDYQVVRLAENKRMKVLLADLL